MKGFKSFEELNEIMKGTLPSGDASSLDESNPKDSEIEKEEKTYKTIATTGLVTVIAYLIGMDEELLALHYGEHNLELIEQLKITGKSYRGN